MSNTLKIWNINEIKDVVRASGSHWFDPDTLSFFKCRVLEGVYQGDGGVYFVTSERGPHFPRAYTVRKFDPLTCGISTVGEFCKLTRSKAITLAKQSAGPKLIANMAEFRRVTVGEQFLFDLRAHGCKVTKAQAVAIRQAATRHQKIMEDYCNGLAIYNADGEPLPRLKRNRHHLLSLAKAIGAAGVVFSGDPRGNTVKLIFNDKATNDWAKDGWVVPLTKER